MIGSHHSLARRFTLGPALAVLLVIGLSVASFAASCPHKRHDTIVGVQTLTYALGGLQDAVTVACQTGVIPKPQTCRDAGAAFVKVWTIDAQVIEVLLAWKPGQPIPQVVRDEISAVRELVRGIGGMLPPAVAEKVQAVYDTIATMLLAFLPQGGTT